MCETTGVPRPSSCRFVSGSPGAVLFKPAGIPTRSLTEVVMTLDEFEAIRLADLEGLYQEEAARRMGISRTTFGRILDSAHRKVAEVLSGGRCLRLEGGHVHPAEADEPPSITPRQKETIVNICIPVTADRGLESPVSGHFGSAPIFMLVDVGTRQTKALSNAGAVHEHGACRPLDALAGHDIDALVVGGIGAGALMKLQGAGIRVYRATAPTVAGCLDAFVKNEAEEIGPGGACGRHGQGHGEEHDHGCRDRVPAAALPTRS
jgi:predicted DNA-binding protein (UPF0251 family)/predicted Fe-Mo cluster-binding NifX family protein